MAGFVAGRGKDFYREQLRYLATNDIEGMLREHYHPDAVMVTFDGIRRGHDELRRYFANTLSSMGQITGLSTDYFVETDDCILFKASITDSKRGTVKADNALYLKDGRIYRHLALTILPMFDYAAFGTRWKD